MVVRRATRAVSMDSAPGAMAGEGGVALLPSWQDMDLSGMDSDMHEGTRRSRGWLLVVGVLLVGSAGCSSPVERGEYPAYSGAPDEYDLLDIQVMRRGTKLEMTNTTTVSFGPSRVWANREYSEEISGFEVGKTVHLRLGDFRNQFGQRFKEGGFFATELPDALVCVEIESEGVMHRTKVVEDTMN